ncbi:kunitz-type serine protease inhibitor DrTI-like [Prosopis cineraria]|uniref:kunitz-type serine protease inhibitor DrTI-like n=1 Tax=Prosopis cineraria TaxID=364024 RepID=UPI00240F5050|nr:kunitz-type serine protease inhibitor DrTI-like [Prosopis cineraria]
MPARSLIIALSFLLWFAFTTTNPLPVASASGEEPVIDIQNEPVVPGQEYYIVSAIWGAGGGGVFPGRTVDASSCAYSVLQSGNDMFQGAPLKFHVKGTSTGKIYPGSTNLEIEFVHKPACAESSKWVAAYDESGSSWSVVIGGPEDHPDSKLVSGVFRFEALGFGYKLVFCPYSTVIRSSGNCYDVGLDVANGSRKLVVRNQNSGNPFWLVIQKVASGKGKFSII